MESLHKLRETLPEPPQITFAGHIAALGKLLGRRYFRRIRRFKGTPEQICEQILEALWTHKFYLTSLGHYSYLWIRDFGTVADALVQLGHKKRVHTTIRWALQHYKSHGRVTLCIDSLGQTFNAPEQSIDALPWLLHAIVVSDFSLSENDRSYLELQLYDYAHTFLSANGMLHDGHFAELRDGVLYHQSAYAVTMVARLAQCVQHLGLRGFRFRAKQYRELLLETYWNGHYFNADSRTSVFSAECNLFPFTLGIIDDADKATSVLNHIHATGLDRPYPMRYTNDPSAFRQRWWARSVMRNYAGTTIWTWHGAFYLQLLRHYGHVNYAAQLTAFEAMIVRYGTFPELLRPDGTWYKTIVYKGDEGMVWCALYLTLAKSTQ